jgi:hypothetical protein
MIHPVNRKKSCENGEAEENAAAAREWLDERIDLTYRNNKRLPDSNCGGRQHFCPSKMLYQGKVTSTLVRMLKQLKVTKISYPSKLEDAHNFQHSYH